MRRARSAASGLPTATLAAALLAVWLLTGCGKKGPPEPPGPPAAITYPKTYPTR